MARYKWISLTSGDAAGKPVLAFIAPASGFYGERGQEEIKKRLELLTKRGFEVQIPAFSLRPDELDIDAFPTKIDFNIAQQKAALKQIQVVIEPNVANRAEADFPALLPRANSPETGARIIIDCIKEGWNMMPLAGGKSFQNKLPYVKQYFAQHPNEKDPTVNIFGYSNISFANSLALDGICSYMPTQFTNNFTKIADIESKPNLSAGEQEWLKFLEGQAAKLTSALEKPASVSHENKKIIYLPPNQALQGNSTHYPLNIDVLDEAELDLNFFTPNPKEKWSFAIEWMMQTGDNPATFSNAVELLDKFLDRNKAHLPEFIELGVLGTRFDGMNGFWDLIYDEDGLLKVDDANVAIISFKTKVGFVETLNKFLTNYKACIEKDDENKLLHGALPVFLQNKLDPALNKIGEVDGAITDQEIKEVFKWRNEVFQRVKNQVLEIAVKYNLPLVQNSNFGHVANMSPTVAGPCEYRFEGLNLNLKKADRTLTAAAAKELKEIPKISAEKPRSFVESASAGNIRNRDGLSSKL